MNEKETGGSQRFFILLIIGFALFFIGAMVLMVATLLSDDSASFGAVIFIGPFPIVIGAGPEATWMILFAVVLAVLTVLMFFILRRESGKAAA
jgi:uncharacterized membrane protein